MLRIALDLRAAPACMDGEVRWSELWAAFGGACMNHGDAKSLSLLAALGGAG